MDFRYLVQGAASAERMRQRNYMTGRAGTGLIWSKDEIETVKRLYPDYVALQQALPHRTLSSITSKAQGLGITTTRRIWTAAKASKLRSKYRRAPRDEVMATFPGYSWQHIKTVACRAGLKRPKPAYCPTGFPLLDAIRDRCRQLSLTMVELDEFAKTGRYFQAHLWRKKPEIAPAMAAKAAAVLDGTLTIQWADPASP